MDLDQKSIDEFKRIWQEEFGEELSDGETKIVASNLLELYFLLAQKKGDTEGTKEV